jgi:hypothetical protein
MDARRPANTGKNRKTRDRYLKERPVESLGDAGAKSAQVM